MLHQRVTMGSMPLSTAEYDRYDQHLGTAAEAALAGGNEQLAALLADCHVTDVTYIDSLMSLASDEVWAGVRVHLEAPAHVVTRLTGELIGEFQMLINTTLRPEGETVLEISVVSTPAAPGWRERVIPTLSLDDPGAVGN